MDVEAFLDAAAAKRPDPGGGAVAGLAGALAASMGAMSLRYSMRKKDAVHHETHAAAIDRLDELRASLTGAIDADQRVYAALVEARKSGGDVAAAARKAVAVPMGVAGDAAEVLTVAAGCAATCNEWLLSDLGVCCDLAMATVRCGVWNVRANLGDVPEDERGELLDQCEHLHAECVVRVKTTTEAITARMA